MSAGRCRLHSVRRDPFRLGALAYLLGCVFLPCPKPHKRSSKWHLLVYFFSVMSGQVWRAQLLKQLLLHYILTSLFECVLGRIKAM